MPPGAQHRIEKGIIKPEHHGRSNNRDASECGLNRKLPFTAAANVRGNGRWVGSDPGNVHEMPDPGPTRLCRKVRCRPDMYRMKRVGPMLEIETDSVYHSPHAGHRSRQGALVFDIRTERFDLRAVISEQRSAANGVPGGDPNRKAMITQMTNDPAAEEPGSTEHAHARLQDG